MEPSKIEFTKSVYLLKKSIDGWIDTKLCCGTHDCFNPGYLPIFITIAKAEATNNDVAQTLKVSKQAASKVIKELEVMGLVQSEKNKDDARAVVLTLTPEGRKFYEHIFGQLETLEETYKKVVGTKNYENAIKVISQLTSFHEQMTKKEQ